MSLQLFQDLALSDDVQVGKQAAQGEEVVPPRDGAHLPGKAGQLAVDVGDAVGAAEEREEREDEPQQDELRGPRHRHGSQKTVDDDADRGGEEYHEP